MTVRFVGIGINQYPNVLSVNPRLSADLDYAAQDCQTLASEIEGRGLSSVRHILADGYGLTRPWRGAIWRLIRSLKTADEPILFYFAGHGLAIGGELHVCPGDFDPEIADKTAIPVSEIITELFPKAPWSVVILDCCRAPLSGTADDLSLETGGMLRIADNIVVMFACSHGEQSFEAPVIGDGFGGVFSHFLGKSFQKAFVRKSKVSVRDIFNAARDETCSFVNEEGRRQTPRMMGAQGDDFYFVREPISQR